MKKIIFIFILLFSTNLFLFTSAKAEENLETQEIKKFEYVLFYSESCPHCHAEINFINKNLMLPEYSQYIDFRFYDIAKTETRELINNYSATYNIQIRGVPIAFIAGEVVSGFASEDTTGREILNIIDKEIKKTKVEENKNVTEPVLCEDEKMLEIPFLGTIYLKDFSLPIITIIIGLLDGFNPCAMWVLLFLISLLLGMENRKKMIILGSLFVLTSGIVYFFFMAAWLNFIMFIGMLFLIRLFIGLIAVTVGTINLRDFWKNRKTDGVVCKVSKNTKTQKIFDKIKNIVYRDSFLWSVVGILILGFSVNLVELACSAGFPAIFTQILAMSELFAWQKYSYMALYIFFYMLDDLVVFLIAMFTLKTHVVGTKYAKYTNLISGLLILILGLLLIFRPEWLMFA